MEKRRHIRTAVAFLFIIGGLVAAAKVSAQETGGAFWFPEILEQGRPYLPDFSYAGYRWGEEALPEPDGVVVEASQHGVVPDDGRDDTEALRRAMEAVGEVEGPVVLELPAGRIILRQILFIERSHFVLRGKGSDEGGTMLYVPQPLSEIVTPAAYRQPLPNGNSQFAYQGGVLWTRLPDPPEDEKIGAIYSGRRGGHTFTFDEAASRLQVGDIVRIKWFNHEGKSSSLLEHIYGRLDVRFGRFLYQSEHSLVTQEVTITDVEGPQVTIKEPLLHDLRDEWTKALWTVDFLEEVGIEHLRVQFPETPYPGHHEEAGYNALFLTQLAHSWVRDVATENADSGLLSRYNKNVTIDGFRTFGREGHYSIHIGSGYGMLVKDIGLYAQAIHNPSFNTNTQRSVYSGGHIRGARLDQHNGVNHQNLFDNLFTTFRDASSSRRLFAHGGSDRTSPTAGAFNTFWNVCVNVQGVDEKDTIEARVRDAAPHARLVGLRSNVSIELDYGPDPYVEGLNKSDIAVTSLYRHQLRERLGEHPASLSQKSRSKIGGCKAAYGRGEAAQLGVSYPNPFRRKTTVEYTLFRQQRVQLHVYSLRGRVIRTPVNEMQSAGDKKVTIRAGNLSSGVYFYQVSGNKGYLKRGKMVLIR